MAWNYVDLDKAKSLDLYYVKTYYTTCIQFYMIYVLCSIVSSAYMFEYTSSLLFSIYIVLGVLEVVILQIIQRYKLNIKFFLSFVWLKVITSIALAKFIDSDFWDFYFGFIILLNLLFTFGFSAFFLAYSYLSPAYNLQYLLRVKS